MVPQEGARQGVVALFAGADDALDTAWSPCTEIAFTVVEVITPGELRILIYVMDSDGSNVRELTRGSAPSWSPDCSKIVFAGNDLKIQIINADGSGLRTLTRR